MMDDLTEVVVCSACKQITSSFDGYALQMPDLGVLFVVLSGLAKNGMLTSRVIEAAATAARIEAFKEVVCKGGHE